MADSAGINWQDPPRPVRSQLQGMVAGEAWKIVLLLITEKLRQLQAFVSAYNASPEIRLYSVERQEALLELLDMIYKVAEEPNPVSEARIALTTQWATPFHVTVSPNEETGTAAATRRVALPAYGAGSVR